MENALDQTERFMNP